MESVGLLSRGNGKSKPQGASVAALRDLAATTSRLVFAVDTAHRMARRASTPAERAEASDAIKAAELAASAFMARH